jgi:hypothetical protein
MQKQNRSFGYLMAFALALVGGVKGWWLLIGVGVMLAAIAHVRPGALEPMTRAWLKFGEWMSFLVQPVVLAAVYFGAVTPVGWLRRSLGRGRFDAVRFSEPRDSYWLPKLSDKPVTLEEMKRQYQ